MVTDRPHFRKIATDAGTYWRSDLGQAVLLQRLRQCQQGPMFKLANIGGSAETEFEQAFASLAFAYLKDKAPRLIDFMVGFQLIDRNEDSTKAMGVFGFRVGGRWLYAPVFFLNADMKGHELLYVKDQDLFVPLKENWVNYLMAKQPHVLGEPSDDDVYQSGGLQPEIRRMAMIPGFGKLGSDLDSWVRPIMPMLASFQTKQASALYRKEASPTAKLAMDQIVRRPFEAALATVKDRLDMQLVLPDHLGLLKSAFEISQRYPWVKRGFDRFYGRDCFSRWATEHKRQAMSNLANIMPVKQAAARPDPRDIRLVSSEPEKTGAVRVYVYESLAVTQNLNDLDDQEREKLLKDTVLIKDERDPHGTSKVYNTQVEQKLQNPHESGLYRVLEQPGEFSRMLIISRPVSNDGGQDFCTVVRIGDSGSKAWLNAHRSHLWADKIELREEFDQWFEGLGDRKSLKKGGLYLAIGQDGAATLPFEVREVYGDGAYRVDFKNNCDYAYNRQSDSPSYGRLESHGPGEYVSPYGAKLYMDAEGGHGKKLRAIQGELRVPGDFKILTLQKPPKPKKQRSEYNLIPGCGIDCCNVSGSEDRPIKPGKLEDLQLLFTEKTSAVKLWDFGNEVQVDSRLGGHRMNKIAALVHLVCDHGVTERCAREMLKQAVAKTGKRFRITYAPGYGLIKQALGPGPNAPGFPPANLGMEVFGRRGVGTIHPQQEQHSVPELSGGMTDPSVWDNWQNYEHQDLQKSMQSAQQAAQSGQKEVFDTSVMRGLLKTVRQDTHIERYLGSLVQALDKLGRLLFLFFWHQEEWEDRYGKSELPELEDSLRNAFESLGDLTIFLKEKSVEPIGDEVNLDLKETARV